MPDGRKLTILVDMDDVMEDLLPAWLEVLNEKTGKAVFLGDITEWNFDDLYPELTKEQIREVLNSWDLWRRVYPKTGAKEYMRRLIEDGHDVYVVTASHPDTMSEKYNTVICEHFPFIKATQIISTYHKQMIRGDVLIDDGPHNLAGGDYFKILMDAPHNRAVDEHQIGAVRVQSWYEVYDIIQKLSQDRLGV